MVQNDAVAALKIFFLLPESSCISGSAVLFFTNCLSRFYETILNGVKN